MWVGVIACGGNAADGPSHITVAPSDLKVVVGLTLDVAASYQDSDGRLSAASDASWTIANPAIAGITPGTGGHAALRGITAGVTTLSIAGKGVTETFTVTVAAPTLMSIAITPPTPSVAAGTSVQLAATGTFNNMTTADLTAMVTWSSSAAATATVSTAGLLQGLRVGDTVVTAALGAITGTTTASITAATLVSISVTPPNPSLAAGTTLQLTATGVFSDTTHQDLTNQVTWSSNATTHATVAATGLVTATGVGPAVITATKGTISGSTTVTVTDAVLASIAITPPTPSVARGRKLQLAATGTLTDGTTQNLTTQVTWTSGTAATATIDAGGLVSSVDVGTSTITAKLGEIDGTTLLTVSPAVLDAISVTPPAPSVARGRTLQFHAQGTFSDGTNQDLTTQVLWLSSAAAVAEISNADGTRGLATSLAKGTTTVTAKIETVEGTTDLTVTDAVLDSIAVTPINPSVGVGSVQQFVATGTFSDRTTQNLTDQVTWTSNAEAVATISNDDDAPGLATTHTVGPATISAALGTIHDETLLTVTTATLVSIAVTPTKPSIARGRTQQFAATGTYTDRSTQNLTAAVAWSSSTAAATISNADDSKGLATGAEVGATTISAKLDTITGSTSLEVTAAVLTAIAVAPIQPSTAAGTKLQFHATGTFSDTTTQDLTGDVTWSSSDEAVATISSADGSEGEASAAHEGTATITATLGLISGSTELTVTDALLVAVEVTPITPSLARGRMLTFTATGRYSDASTLDLTAQATWESSDEAVAKVSNVAGSHGLATALGLGAAQISAAFGGKVGSTVLTVTDAALEAIVLTPVDASLPVGLTQQFLAVGTYSDLTEQDLTTQVVWSSSEEVVATASNADGSRGLVTAVTVGSTTIVATLGPVSGSTQLTVTAAAIASIVVTPVGPSVAKGRVQQFTAEGTFTDGVHQDLTATVTWASDDTTVAQVSNAVGSRGLASALAVGAATISATQGSVTGSTRITVTAAVLEAIVVTPPTATVIVGGKQRYTATGTFSDATSQDLTSSVTWGSDAPTIAQVSNAGSTRGEATGIAVGSAAISATLGTVTGSAAIVVVGLTVTATLPRDGAVGIRATTPIIVTFSSAIDPATLTTQTAAGACTGSLQASTDNFATCIGFTGAALNGANTVATATPAGGLVAATTYRIRVVGVTNAGGGALMPFTQATGFAISAGGTCAQGLVISQVFGGGQSTGATFRSDYIELHNGGSSPINLAGFAVQYAASMSGSWAVTALPSVVVAPGGYFLIQQATGTAGAALVADFVPATLIAMSATNGKVALTASTTALNGTCPLGLTNDLVGYGDANCAEGADATAALSATRGALRNANGCADANITKNDFTVALPTPRNALTAPSICACSPTVVDEDPGMSFLSDN